jgi:ATP-dependent protease ClpP protease subunit/DNA-binding XRE family transcriptional regulator
MIEPLRRMAESRARLIRELAERRAAAGLSQTEVAARMGTSQSAVARLESGASDVRASTLERYAAAVGGQIGWDGDRPVSSASVHAGFPQPPGTPGSPETPGPPTGPLPPSRVWLDPHAQWQDALAERLLASRIVFAHGVLDDDAATRLSAQFLALDAEASTPIRVELQNLRAELPAALAVMGVLDTLRAPARAYVSGELTGPALGLLACCPVRLGYPNATFTMTEPRLDLGTSLTAAVVSARQQQASRMVDALYFRIAEATGQDSESIRADARSGRTFTTAEAIGYGLLTGRASREELLVLGHSATVTGIDGYGALPGFLIRMPGL